MVKVCGICGYKGELTWRDGKYHCAMCGSEVAETQPVAQSQPEVSQQVVNAECPICRNTANNTYQSGKYHCGMCGTWFELRQPAYQPQQNTYNNYSNSNYGGATYLNSVRYNELKKEKSKNFSLGILFIFLFWPVSIYFFYKYNKVKKEMQSFVSY
jgi:transcription initiation factor TFIIIB Brf1 subunit/transcription initiation factor TFIIB